MSRHEIIVTDTVGDQIEEIVGGGLNAHNDEVTGYADGQPLAVLTALMITEGIVESRRQTPSPALREKVASVASRMRVRRASALGPNKRHAPHPPTSWVPPSPAVQERGYHRAYRLVPRSKRCPK